MAVSNPLRGADPTDSSWSGLAPASTSQVEASVAPFQLTYSVTSPSGPASATTAGASLGCPFHGKRKARYDSSSGVKLASKSSLPSRPNSEKNGSLPHPTNTLPFGNSCTLPWVSENISSGWVYSPTSVALMASSSISTTMPRDCSFFFTLPLSKSLLFPPSRHATSPVLVLRSTL